MIVSLSMLFLCRHRVATNVGRSALLSPFFRPARFRPLGSANLRLFLIRAPFRPVFSSFLGLSRVDFIFSSDEGSPAQLFYLTK